MKWSEMTTARKILTVVEHVSNILYWIFFILHMADILDALAVVLVLMLMHSACRMFTESTKIFRILWGVIFVLGCLLSVWALWQYLR